MCGVYLLIDKVELRLSPFVVGDDDAVDAF